MQVWLHAGDVIGSCLACAHLDQHCRALWAILQHANARLAHWNGPGKVQVPDSFLRRRSKRFQPAGLIWLPLVTYLETVTSFGTRP